MRYYLFYLNKNHHTWLWHDTFTEEKRAHTTATAVMEHAGAYRTRIVMAGDLEAARQIVKSTP